MAIFAENIKLSVSDQIITGSHETDGDLNDVLIFSKLFEEEVDTLTESGAKHLLKIWRRLPDTLGV